MSELNTKSVGVMNNADEAILYVLNPLPQHLGRKFGKDFPRVQKALREGAPDDVRGWALSLLNGESITVDLGEDTFEVSSEECEVKQQAAEGFAVAEDHGYVAAVDIRLTDALINEGLAREVVRRVQGMRRDADFDIDDNINIVYTASKGLQTAIDIFADYIKAETLALSLEQGEPSNGYFKADFTDEEESKRLKGETMVIGVQRVTK